MHKSLSIIFVIALSTCLTGCSWQEYFVILNTGSSDVIIQYEIAAVDSGFPIFTHQPVLHALKASQEIDWHTHQTPTDLDTSSTGLKIKIPANYAVVLGALNNDHYKKYNQQFINARVFNLKELEVLRSRDTLNIVPTNFDAFFKKKSGNIALEIK